MADLLALKIDFMNCFFGFFLYVVGRSLLDAVKSEANRVLKQRGMLAILEYDVSCSYVNPNHHDFQVTAFKDSYENIFIYIGFDLVAKVSLFVDCDIGFETEPDKHTAIILLYKM